MKLFDIFLFQNIIIWPSVYFSFCFSLCNDADTIEATYAAASLKARKWKNFNAANFNGAVRYFNRAGIIKSSTACLFL